MSRLGSPYVPQTVLCAIWLLTGIRLLAFQADERVYVDRLNARVDMLIDRFSKLPKKPIIFSGNLIFAHGQAIRSVPLPLLLKYAGALKEAGCQRIDFNPGVTSVSNPEAAAKYDALVRHIRQLGVQIAINPAFLQGEMRVSSFTDFQAVALKTYAELAERYKPDNFVLVHEPTTMAARMGIRTTPADWHQFIVASARVIKQASPHSRLGAGSFVREARDFYQDFASIPELDFLTADIYSGGQPSIERLNEMVEIAHSAHKAVYIEETWRPHFLPQRLPRGWQSRSMEEYSVKGIGYAGFEPLDIKWLEAMALFAATHGMEAMTAFRTTCFFLYVTSGPDRGNNSTYHKQVLEAIERGRRTRTFEAFQEYSRKWGRSE